MREFRLDVILVKYQWPSAKCEGYFFHHLFDLYVFIYNYQFAYAYISGEECAKRKRKKEVLCEKTK